MKELYIWTEQIIDSEHSFLRSKQRGGLSRKKASRMMELARTRGITYEECGWSMDKQYLQNHTTVDAVAVAYNGFCFILKRENGKCITMFELPRWFGHKKRMFRQEDRSKPYLYMREAV